MNASYRRYEILLPLRFNDGQTIPDELLATTFLELRNQFGAISVETQSIHGQWQQLGEIYRDELLRVFVDVEDSNENLDFFNRYKKAIEDRFRQIEIRITSHPINVL